MATFAKAAVIGAGTMGSGIAAHLANAGLEVILLDLDAELARAGIDRQRKSGGFMHDSLAERVAVGSIGQDIGRLADCDWIIEAVAERTAIKRNLYAAIEAVRRTDAIVSSNTSTIPLAQLTAEMSANMASHFLVTHFFNPPRQMRLLEVVAGPATLAGVTRRITEFGDIGLGKGVIEGRDTPGFIANRIGCFWLAAGQSACIELGLDIETADAISGKPFGIPKTGVFGLLDLIGVDLFPQIVASLQASLPAADPIQSISANPPLISAMVAAGQTGRKGGAGFYRMSGDPKTRETIDPASGLYGPSRGADRTIADSSPEALLARPDAVGEFARRVLLRSLTYAASLVPEISDSVADIDAAMRLGYGWSKGPFELLDSIDDEALRHAVELAELPVPSMLNLAWKQAGFYRGEQSILGADGGYAPVPEPDGRLSISRLSGRHAPVLDAGAARLWDFGDGVAGLELTTKLNTFSPQALDAVADLVARAERDFAGLVIGSDAATFSAGADLRHVLALAEAEDRAALRQLVRLGQQTFRAIKFARIPVVGAVAGMALGGGCEVLLHCTAIQAHAESQIGLVEPSVGLIPAWGGCTEMLARLTNAAAEPLEGTANAFDLIANARTSTSAYDARMLGFLRPSDRITMNRDRLLADAKQFALELAPNFVPRQPEDITLAGAAAADILSTRLAGTAHDQRIGAALIGVLTGGAGAFSSGQVPEDTILGLEEAAFLDLLETSATQERIRRMIETGKALKN